MLFTLGSFAQDQDILVKKNEFGIHVGATTGIGLSYRYWPAKIGLQLTLVPIKTDNFMWISAGITGLYSFYDSKYIRFFGYLGNHLIIYNYEVTTYDYLTGKSIERTSENNTYNIGIGPGFGFGKIVRFNFMVGYGFYDISDKLNMFPSGEIGLYYRF